MSASGQTGDQLSDPSIKNCILHFKAPGKMSVSLGFTFGEMSDLPGVFYMNCGPVLFV